MWFLDRMCFFRGEGRLIGMPTVGHCCILHSCFCRFGHLIITKAYPFFFFIRIIAANISSLTRIWCQFLSRSALVHLPPFFLPPPLSPHTYPVDAVSRPVPA